jgi:outer membrane protein TolC
VFDPAVTAEVAKSASRRQSEIAPFLTGATEPFQNTFESSAGLEKKFSTGATADLEFQTGRLGSNSAVQRFDPSWGSDLVLSLTQPLLKDFGREYNLGQIVIAKNNREISDSQFRQRVIDVVSAVKETYWDLVRAIELLDVAEQSLGLAQELLEINKAKVEAGQLAPIDVVEAEAGVAFREEAVILAEDTIRDVEEVLRSFLNLDKELELPVSPIIPVDQPVDTRFSFSLSDSVRTAFTNRPEYLQIQKDLENRRVAIDLAKNQVKPRVDLVASAGVTGLGSTWENSTEEFDGDYYDLRIGLRFKYPLGNRAARSQLVRRKLEQRQAELRIEDLEKNITLEVRSAIRQVQTNFKRIQTTRVSRRLAERKLEAEQAKFEVGISTTTDVLDFQVDLALARSRETEALIDYNKSLITLYQALGTTLERNNITTDLWEQS